MEIFTNALTTALSSLFNSVPAILGALLILLVFWIIGGVLGKLVSKVLQSLKFDTLPARLGFEKSLQNAGVTASPSGAFGTFVKWFVRLLGISAAVSALGLAQVSVFLNQVLAYLPNVLVAVIILLLGLFIAQLVGRLVTGAAKTARFSNATLVGKLAQYALIFFVGLIVMEQLQVGSAIIIGLWSAVAGGLSLALAIAVGLGGREVAHSYLTGRMLAQDLTTGSTIAMQSGATGRVAKVGSFYTTIITNDGQLKVPNSQITQSTLRVLNEGTASYDSNSVAVRG